MFKFISLILVLVGIFSERVDVLFVAALFALISAAGIAWVRTRRTFRSLLDILVALVGLLLDTETLRNKFYAVLLIACTIPVVFLEGDATATVFVGFIAVPMFFAKENWIY